MTAEQTARTSAAQQEASRSVGSCLPPVEVGGSAGSGMSQSPRAHTAGDTSTTQVQVEG